MQDVCHPAGCVSPCRMCVTLQDVCHPAGCVSPCRVCVTLQGRIYVQTHILQGRIYVQEGLNMLA